MALSMMHECEELVQLLRGCRLQHRMHLECPWMSFGAQDVTTLSLHAARGWIKSMRQTSRTWLGTLLPPYVRSHALRLGTSLGHKLDPNTFVPMNVSEPPNVHNHKCTYTRTNIRAEASLYTSTIRVHTHTHLTECTHTHTHTHFPQHTRELMCRTLLAR